MRGALLVDDPGTVETIVQCVRRVREEFSWDAVGQAFEGLLEDAVGASAEGHTGVRKR